MQAWGALVTSFDVFVEVLIWQGGSIIEEHVIVEMCSALVDLMYVVLIVYYIVQNFYSSEFNSVCRKSLGKLLKHPTISGSGSIVLSMGCNN